MARKTIRPGGNIQVNTTGASASVKSGKLKGGIDWSHGIFSIDTMVASLISKLSEK